jgi:hypothetical protein
MSTIQKSSSAKAPALSFVTSPIYKSALGIAVGLVSGLCVFGLTIFHVVLQPTEAMDLTLLAQYFYGYSVSWGGAVLGLLWGFVVGFVFGWFGAFVRNVVIAVLVFRLRTKAELAQTADFLDHI